MGSNMLVRDLDKLALSLSMYLRPQCIGPLARRPRFSGTRCYAHKARAPSIRRREAEKKHVGSPKEFTDTDGPNPAGLDHLIPPTEIFISAQKAGFLTTEHTKLQAFLRDFLLIGTKFDKRDQVRELCTIHDLPISTLPELSRIYSTIKVDAMVEVSQRLLLYGCVLGDPLSALTLVEKTFRNRTTPPAFEPALKQVQGIARNGGDDPLSLRAEIIIARYLMGKSPKAGLRQAEKMLKRFDSLPATEANNSLHAKLLYETAITMYKEPKSPDKADVYLKKAAFELDDAGAYWALVVFNSRSRTRLENVRLAEYSMKAAISGIPNTAWAAGHTQVSGMFNDLIDKWQTLRSRRIFGIISLSTLARLLYPSGVVRKKASVRGSILRLVFQLESWTWNTDTTVAQEWLRLSVDETNHETVKNYLTSIIEGEVSEDPDLWNSLQHSPLSDSDRRDGREMSAKIAQTGKNAQAQILYSIGIFDHFSMTGKRIESKH